MANAWIIKPLPFTATSPHTAVGAPGNVTLDYAGIIWRSVNTAFPNIYIDLGADTVVDTVMLFGLAGGIAAGTVQVYASTAAEGTGSGYARANGGGDLLAGSAMPESGFGTGLIALPSAWPAVRYLRIEIGQTASYIQVSRVVINKRIALSRNFGFGAGFGVRDLGSLDFSARGVLLRRRAAKLRTTALTFSNARKDEVEAAVKPLLEQIGNTECVALVMDPDANAQRQNRCYFGPLVGDLGVIWRNAAAWEAKVNVVSLF